MCKIISVAIQQLWVIFAALHKCFLVICCHIRGDGRVCFCCRAVGSNPPAWQTSTWLWCPAALNTWTPAGINKVWHYWMCHLPICFCAGRCQQRVMFVSLSSDAIFRLSWAWTGKYEIFFFFFCSPDCYQDCFLLNYRGLDASLSCPHAADQRL